ncbi:hypothetical protein GE21DRAFT_1286890 [Neurospora crassa]|nr:hypothetical protein GE21DRAFT_1293072 [Neurospora crassa]KHE83608.1 hypothetical protein GE21DRAFT_1286890 [Neurospora crassa]
MAEFPCFCAFRCNQSLKSSQDSIPTIHYVVPSSPKEIIFSTPSPLLPTLPLLGKESHEFRKTPLEIPSASSSQRELTLYSLQM